MVCEPVPVHNFKFKGKEFLSATYFLQDFVRKPTNKSKLYNELPVYVRAMYTLIS